MSNKEGMENSVDPDQTAPCIAVRSWTMTCDFTSFSTVFQSYQDDGQMIMKGCVQWNPTYY